MQGRGRGIGRGINLEAFFGTSNAPVAQVSGRGIGLLGSALIGQRGTGRGAGALALARSLGARRNVSPEPAVVKVYSTKPDTIGSKEGSSGTVVALSANYFKLNQMPGFEFNMYRVDFLPNTEDLRLRKFCLSQHRELLGGYLYDGQNLLYMTRSLHSDNVKLDSLTRDGDVIKVTLRNTRRTIDMTDASAVQVLNLILRRAMDGLEMQLVGRNLYDPGNKVRVW
jgi:aubergine